MKTNNRLQQLTVLLIIFFLLGSLVEAQDTFYYFQGNKILLKKVEKENIPKSMRIDYEDSFQNNDFQIYECGGARISFGKQFTIKLKDTVSISSVLHLIKKYDCDTLRATPYTERQYYIGIGNSSYSSVELANLFYETELFEFSEPDILYLDALFTADPYWNKQWGLKNIGQEGGTSAIDINVEAAWDILGEEATIKVAVLDQGVQLSHPDLKENLLTGRSIELGTNGSAQKGDTHGTCCAGIIAAVKDNNVGICGVAPKCKIIPINAWGYELLSIPYFPSSYLADGIRWAYKNGKADVISNSWGSGAAPSSDITNAIHDAVTKGRDGKGCAVIFASGNYNEAKVCENTSKMDEVLMVGAIDRCGFRSGSKDVTQSCDPWTVSGKGSNYGQKLGVVAPGSSVYTTSNEGYEMFGGTSAACPHVAGVAALMLAANPNLTYTEVYTLIQKTARKLQNYQFVNEEKHPHGSWNEEVGYGLVDAYAATMAACNTIKKIENENITATKNIKSCGTVVIKNTTISSSGKLKVETSGSVEIDSDFSCEEGGEFEIMIK